MPLNYISKVEHCTSHYIETNMHFLLIFVLVYYYYVRYFRKQHHRLELYFILSKYNCVLLLPLCSSTFSTESIF